MHGEGNRQHPRPERMLDFPGVTGWWHAGTEHVLEADLPSPGTGWAKAYAEEARVFACQNSTAIKSNMNSPVSK
jgi:hypothetical protein